MRLLILDDEVMAVEITLRQVNWKKCGIDEVFTAYSARGAREIVEQIHIDVILCDIEMPGENGIEFMQWARKNGYDMVCIFLTCHAKFEYAQEAVRLDSMDYLLLPAPYNVIEDKVAKAVHVIVEREKKQKMEKLGQSLYNHEKEKIVEEYGEVKNKNKIVLEAEQYIQLHIGDFDLSVVRVAEAVGLHPDYIGMLFKHKRNITINKYIVQHRMDMAKLLLEEDSLSTVAIAEKVGYESYPYFSTSFKKEFGVSPATYRKNNHKK